MSFPSSALLIHFPLDGGTESLGITAGETKNPSKNMPRVVKFVFWRWVAISRTLNLNLTDNQSILLFYILSILLIGLNGTYIRLYFVRVIILTPWHLVPWDYPNLSNKTTTTSPFTIVFKRVGSSMFASAFYFQCIFLPFFFDFSCSRLLHEHRHPDVCTLSG